MASSTLNTLLASTHPWVCPANVWLFARWRHRMSDMISPLFNSWNPAKAALFLMAASLASSAVLAQSTNTSNDGADGGRAGKNFITTTVYTAQQDEQILARYEGLRVADVSDGMDAVGLQNT